MNINDGLIKRNRIVKSSSDKINIKELKIYPKIIHFKSNKHLNL